MTNKPSRDSNVRVLPGWPSRVDTRVRRVVDWIAGQLDGSKRSSSSCSHVSVSSVSRLQENGHSCGSLWRKALDLVDEATALPAAALMWI